MDTVKVPDDYDGPHIQLPMTLKSLQGMIVSFKQAKVGVLGVCHYYIISQILHAHYVMLILTKVCKLLQTLPNITRATTHISQQITICGMLKLCNYTIFAYICFIPSTESTGW